MTLTISRHTNLSVVNKLFGSMKSTKSRTFSFSFMSLNQRDMFSSTSLDQILQQIVRKMQGAVNIQPFAATSSTLARPSSASFGSTPGLLEAKPFEPEQWQVDEALGRMGGIAAISPWMVDGKTKVDINGRKAVVTVDEQAAANAEKANASLSARDQAAAAIERFGMDASRLDGDLEALKTDLRSAADQAKADNSHVATAIEYALEDAFAKLHQLQTSSNGDTNVDTAESAYQNQLNKNLGQASDVAAKLGLDSSQSWGLDSLAADLAVFGKDFTSMSGDVGSLAEEIKSQAQQMVADLEARYVGTESEFYSQRNRITGACSRLVNGLANGAVGSFDVVSATSSQVNVTIDGVSVNAGKLVAMGNIVVDPLVLDMNGDGIDLSAAEDGVEFDMNGDGEKKGMGFIRGDDALLFVDTHGDGIVHDGRQLFGNAEGYANGFEMLAQYDDNGDGVIDENDAIYDKLRLWQEKTEDGICEEHETMSLREAGIKAINLGYQNTREDDGKGNLVGQKGSFTRDDGSTGLTADVWLRERAAETAGI